MSNKEMINYLQIDFLRLFRLCRNMNIIFKKRKMPIEYINENKAFEKSLTANKRLFTVFLKKLFDGYTISNEKYLYYISLPDIMVKNIIYIEKLMTELLSNNSTSRQIDILQRYLNLKDGIKGHIFLNSQIVVNLLSSDANSPPKISSLKGNINRPLQDFYRCAQACIGFKNILERDMVLINQFIIDCEKDPHKLKEEICNKIETKPIIINSSRLNSQLAFNNALQQYRSTPNESREN